MPIRFDKTKDVNEDSSCLITGVVRSPDGQAIPNTSIDTATFTLTDKATGAVINSRTNVDMTSSIDGSGNISLNLSGADNPIVGDPAETRKETHVLTIKIDATVDSVTYNIRENCWIVVTNLKYV